MTTRAFEVYIAHILAPTLQPGQIVALDNLKQHHSDQVREAIEAQGGSAPVPAQLLAGSQADRGGGSPRSRPCCGTAAARTHETLVLAIWAALQAVTSADARGYFTHCGYPILAQHRCDANLGSSSTVLYGLGSDPRKMAALRD